VQTICVAVCVEICRPEEISGELWISGPNSLGATRERISPG
jgi:hypothetical protein